LESHEQEIKEIKDATRDIGPKTEKLIGAINEVITNYKQIKRTVKEWEERQKMVDGVISQLEEGHAKNNILIF
jgi:septal ring factor EnvC (AmiA/AmiB activator)